MTCDPTRSDTLADGFEVRRAVLGDVHVDAAEARTTDFTATFQSLITRYAGGRSGPGPASTGGRAASSPSPLSSRAATGRSSRCMCAPPSETA